LYFSLFYHVFYRITVIGWSALAVVSRYCQMLLLLLLFACFSGPMLYLVASHIIELLSSYYYSW